jgi:hypothetical protein
MQYLADPQGKIVLTQGAFPEADAAGDLLSQAEDQLAAQWQVQREALVALGATVAQARQLEALGDGQQQGAAKAPASLEPALRKVSDDGGRVIPAASCRRGQ